MQLAPEGSRSHGKLVEAEALTSARLYYRISPYLHEGTIVPYLLFIDVVLGFWLCWLRRNLNLFRELFECRKALHRTPVLLLKPEHLLPQRTRREKGISI